MREMLRQRSEGNGEDRRNERMRGREGQMDECERQVRRATIGEGRPGTEKIWRWKVVQRSVVKKPAMERGRRNGSG